MASRFLLPITKEKNKMDITTPADGTAIPQDQTTAPQTSQGDGQENAQNKPVTQADLAVFADTIIKRVQQSSRDRNRQVETELKTIRSRLDGTGVQLNEAQEQALRNKISDDLTPQDDELLASKTPPPALSPDAQYVYDQITVAFKKGGTDVTPNDPEYKLVADALGDVHGSLAATILAAAQASQQKAARITASQSLAANRTMTGGAAANTGDASAMSSHQLWATAYKK